MDRWVRETFPQRVWCNFDIVYFKCFLKIKFFEKKFQSLLFFSRLQYIKNFTRTDTMTKNFFVKVLPLLEASFELISWPSPSMKIQILGGKITEIWGSNPRSVRSIFFVLFLFIFKFSIKNCISLFLTIFVSQIRY